MSDIDMDDIFEPQARNRSHTWHARPRQGEEVSMSDQVSSNDSASSVFEDGAASASKKSGSRKNAWGNFSYADLISRAIESSPEKRLTLAQIYDWLVQNVSYFKDKGDCNSSAGWKNSIRHNLSLHSRFMRVQNEGTGKSSWWMINPDAKGSKSSRCRTSSMDPHGDLVKKRNKVKSRVEELRHSSGLTPALYRSESDTNFSNALNGDQLVDPFAYGQQEFRLRSSSSASSYGRLSPLRPLVEPSSSPGAWGSQQGLAGDGGLMMGPTGSDNLADLWDTALTLSAAEVDPMFGTNASEHLSLNMFGAGNAAYLHSPLVYDEPADIKPLVVQQHNTLSGSHQSLNGNIGTQPQLSPQRIGSGLLMTQPQQQPNTFGMQSPQTNSNATFTQQQLEAQSLINELLADGIKNEAAMRYQYGTNGTNLTPVSSMQQQSVANGRFLVGGSTTVSSQYPPMLPSAFGSQSVVTLPSMQMSVNGSRPMAAGGQSGRLQQLSPKVQQHHSVATVRADSGLLSMMQRQRQHMSGGGLQMVGSSVMPGDIDVSLQELRASGLSCDMEQILRDGNLDLDLLVD